MRIIIRSFVGRGRDEVQKLGPFPKGFGGDVGKFQNCNIFSETNWYVLVRMCWFLDPFPASWNERELETAKISCCDRMTFGGIKLLKDLNELGEQWRTI